MKKYILSIVSAVMLSVFAHAQYVDNALLFSQQYFGGTARSEAMGGAFGSLGGDFSSLSINPAGIGVYRHSEFMFTPNVMHYDKTEATYQGQIADDTEYKFNFNNFGFVTAMPVEGNGAVVSFNFGMGMNRLSNFNQSGAIMANNSSHSITDYFANKTNGIYFDDLVSYDDYDPYNNPAIPWESKLAWENYLINVVDETDDQFVSLLDEGELVRQERIINRSGHIDEYAFSLGANFNHRVYLGATLGVQDLYYKEMYTHREDFGNGGGFDYDSYLRTKGVGVNFKIGTIIRATDFLRLGVAVHTPTIFKLDEDFYSDMVSYLDEDTNESSPSGFYDYKFETPLRLIASAGLVFAKSGLLSIDYEYVDYSRMKLKSNYDAFEFSEDNQEIKEMYQATHNIRVGAEFWALPYMAVRGGCQYYGNPYKAVIEGVTQPNADYSRMVYSGGLGFKGKSAYFDIAYKYGMQESYSYLYQVPNFDAPVKYERNTHDLMFTLGFKF